jgi:hypothetical protein
VSEHGLGQGDTVQRAGAELVEGEGGRDLRCLLREEVAFLATSAEDVQATRHGEHRSARARRRAPGDEFEGPLHVLRGGAARAAPAVEQGQLGFRLGGAGAVACGEERRHAALELALAFSIGERPDSAAHEQELRVVA